MYTWILYACTVVDYDYSMDENITGTDIESNSYHFVDKIGHFGVGKFQFWHIGAIRCGSVAGTKSIASIQRNISETW